MLTSLRRDLSICPGFPQDAVFLSRYSYTCRRAVSIREKNTSWKRNGPALSCRGLHWSCSPCRVPLNALPPAVPRENANPALLHRR